MTPRRKDDAAEEKRAERTEEHDAHQAGLALGAPPDAEPVIVDQFLFFSISGMNLCVPLSQIMAIASVGDTMLDMDYGFDMPALCKGFVKHRRQQVPLLDLRPKFDFPHEAIPPGAIALLIDFGVTYLALMVDFVYSLEQGTAAHILRLPDNISELGNDFLKGYLEYPRGGAFVLDALSIFSETDIEELSAVI